MRDKIRVLVVDDSSLARKIITEGLRSDPDIEIAGSAKDPYEARDLIVRIKPDVITLDVNMPKMDGLEFLKKIMTQFPIPVVMVSSYTETGAAVTLEALAAGAVDFVKKPAAKDSAGISEMVRDLKTKIKIAAFAKVPELKVNDDKIDKEIKKYVLDSDRELSVLAVGASTGGTEAVKSVLRRVGVNSPPALVVLHMPEGFTKAYAQRLDETLSVKAKEAEDGELVKNGCVYVAPGGMQMRLEKNSLGFVISVKKSGLVNRHAPSVDVLFNSVAECANENAVGIILTGMGKDGARGLLNMRREGAYTIAQSEKSSVVFGMPKAALELDAADKVLDLNEISDELYNLLEMRGKL